MATLSAKIKQQQLRRLKRQQRGLPTASAMDLVKLRATTAEREAFAGNHIELLLSIETTIVTHCFENDDDDAVVRGAIQSIVRATPPVSPPVQSLVDSLIETQRKSRCSDEVLHTALRVVYRSLTDVSKCRADEVTYLVHAGEFVGVVQSQGD